MAKRRKKPTTYPANLKSRVDTLRKRIRDWEADALLVTNPRDIRYLTGFIGDDSWALVLGRSAKPTVISDTRFEEQIQREAPHVAAIIRRNGLADELKKLAAKKKLRRIALQSDYVTLSQRQRLADKLGKRRLLDVDDKLIKQRAIKDAAEIKLIRKAGQIQQQAFRKTLKHVRPGITEEKIAGYLEYQMRVLGADGPGFPSIVAADANAALPHAIPGPTKLRRGGILLVDWGATFQGYRSDMTRVLALGKWPRKMKEVYQVVLEAQQAGIDRIGPGVSVKDVDKAARDVIDKAGYGKKFGHGLGHGIGLDIHEEPRLSNKATGELEPNQVVTVEPGIYLPGVGGVRIEDDVLVTERGRQMLTDLPRDLESAII